MIFSVVPLGSFTSLKGFPTSQVQTKADLDVPTYTVNSTLNNNSRPRYCVSRTQSPHLAIYTSADYTGELVHQAWALRARLAYCTSAPEAGYWLEIAPKRRLKIHGNALCANGSEVLLARSDITACRGAPFVLREVGEDLMATRSEGSCIDMGGEKSASYTLWCTGELARKAVNNEPFPQNTGDKTMHSQI
ncbi:hypothetical protein HJFPF1_12254 [Paramyrothecium foliicola]|nr:hypothetical protein HJFPF1_12254 [Paramyrothecium foliicola]